MSINMDTCTCPVTESQALVIVPQPDNPDPLDPLDSPWKPKSLDGTALVILLLLLLVPHLELWISALDRREHWSRSGGNSCCSWQLPVQLWQLWKVVHSVPPVLVLLLLLLVFLLMLSSPSVIRNIGQPNLKIYYDKYTLKMTKIWNTSLVLPLHSPSCWVAGRRNHQIHCLMMMMMRWSLLGWASSCDGGGSLCLTAVAAVGQMRSTAVDVCCFCSTDRRWSGVGSHTYQEQQNIVIFFELIAFFIICYSFLPVDFTGSLSLWLFKVDRKLPGWGTTWYALMVVVIPGQVTERVIKSYHN